MLISQRIAKDPKFIKLQGDPSLFDDYPARIRTAVINSVKFLVPNYGLSIYGENEPTFDDLRKQILGAESQEAEDRRELIYHQFARPCYPTMCLESDQVLLLVTQVKADPLTWQMIYITEKGMIPTHVWETWMEAGEKAPRRGYGALTSSIQKNIDAQLSDDNETNVKKMEERLHAVSYVLQELNFLACELLTLINCSNVARHVVTPKGKETAGLPKVLLPKYSYRVLDVFRERKSYVSLEDAASQLWCSHPERKTRAHLVRGHFKNTRHGLYWWNPFVRNRKNQTTLGIVDKDYRVHSEEKETT